MVYKIIIKPEAEKDLEDALDYYNTKSINLAPELYFEISKILDKIQGNPNLFQKRYKSFRIVFAKRFKYGIHYTLDTNTIFVHAILHTSQNLPK